MALPLLDVSQATSTKDRRKCSDIIGSLNIQILQANRLPDTDIGPGTIDPYVKVVCDQIGYTLMYPVAGEWHSSHFKDNENPVWDKTKKHTVCHMWLFALPIQVRFEIWDKEKIKDKFVGHAELQITDDKEVETNVWFDIKSKSGHLSGRLNISYTLQFLKNYSLEQLDELHPKLSVINLFKMQRLKWRTVNDLEDTKMGFRRNAVQGLELVGDFHDMFILYIFKTQTLDPPEKEYWKKRNTVWRFYIPTLPLTKENEIGEHIRRSQRLLNIAVMFLNKFASRGWRCLNNNLVLVKTHPPIYTSDKTALPRYCLLNRFNSTNELPNINVHDLGHIDKELLEELKSFANIEQCNEWGDTHLSWILTLKDVNFKAINSVTDKYNLYQNFNLRVLTAFRNWGYNIVGDGVRCTILYKEAPGHSFSRSPEEVSLASPSTGNLQKQYAHKPSTPTHSSYQSSYAAPQQQPSPPQYQGDATQLVRSKGEKSYHTWKGARPIKKHQKLIRVVPTTFIGNYLITIQGGINKEDVEDIALKLGSKPMEMFGEQPQIARTLAWSIPIPEMEFHVLRNDPKDREDKLQRALLYTLTNLPLKGWKFLEISNPTEFLLVSSENAKKKTRGEFLILEIIPSVGSCSVEVQGLMSDDKFNEYIRNPIPWKQTTKIMSDGQGYNIWDCELKTETLTLSRTSKIKKLSQAQHYLIRSLDSLAQAGFRVVSPFWQTLLEARIDPHAFDLVLSGFGGNITGLLLQHLPHKQPGYYILVALVFVDKDDVWLEFQGNWKESWLKSVTSIEGVKDISKLGEEAEAGGWHVRIDTTPHPHPKHSHNDKDTNKHYRWFHEANKYLIEVSNILVADGAQFKWRWGNNYMLFFVPSPIPK